VHSESDQLPGLVVDRYGDVAVVQLLSAGAERWREFWPGAIARIAGVRAVYERSDAEVRGLEDWLRARARCWGCRPHVEIVEGGCAIAVDIVSGQKTGFFLDQRDNRALSASLARGADVLNAFCYTGGFSVGALAAAPRASRPWTRRRGPGAGAPQRLDQRRGRAARALGDRGRLLLPAQAARRGPALLAHRPRSAEVRADGEARGARRAPTRTSTSGP
jgi:hypothetical protein